MTKPTLYIFMGYPGAGKTTVARLIADATDGVHLWADFERHIMFGTPTHSKQESHELYVHLNRVTDDLLAQGRCVIFDTNFNFRKDRDYMRDIAAKHDANFVLIWMTTPHDLAKQRATEDSDGKDTRIWGNMAVKDFDRLSGNLQPPDDDEQVIKVDGTHVEPAELKQELGIA